MEEKGRGGRSSNRKVAIFLFLAVAFLALAAYLIFTSHRTQETRPEASSPSLEGKKKGSRIAKAPSQGQGMPEKAKRPGASHSEEQASRPVFQGAPSIEAKKPNRQAFQGEASAAAKRPNQPSVKKLTKAPSSYPRSGKKPKGPIERLEGAVSLEKRPEKEASAPAQGQEKKTPKVVSSGKGMPLSLKGEVKGTAPTAVPSPRPLPAFEPLKRTAELERMMSGSDREMAEKMEQRKEKVGLKESVDLVVKEKERFKIGGKELSIAKILKGAKGQPKVQGKERVRIQEEGSSSATGVQEPIGRRGAQIAQKVGPSFREHLPQEAKRPEGPNTRSKEKDRLADLRKDAEDLYAIHLVREGENLWNIDYRILREYFQRRGIMLPVQADEPLPDGRSSGAARILKFQEKIVYIYNLFSDRLVKNINLIRPHSLIVFFNIGRLYGIIDKMAYEDIQRVRLLHDTLLVPQSLERPDKVFVLTREDFK